MTDRGVDPLTPRRAADRRARRRAGKNVVVDGARGCGGVAVLFAVVSRNIMDEPIHTPIPARQLGEGGQDMTTNRRTFLKASAATAAALAMSGTNMFNLEAATRPPFFAYYYLWWSRKHWLDSTGTNYDWTVSPLPLPAELAECTVTNLYEGNRLLDVPAGPYGQDDAGVIEGHVALAATAMDGFAVNWATVKSTYTPRLERVLEAAAATPGFSIWMDYKSSATIRTLTQMQADISWLISTHGDHAAWDLRYGKPVFIMSGSRKYDSATVAEVSKAVRPWGLFIGDETYKTITESRLSLYDGLTYYWSSQNPYSNPTSFGRIKRMGDMCHANGKLWFAPAHPGFSTKLIGGSTCIPRNDGDCFRKVYDGNAPSNPDGWAFISWNEIAENTYIEPLTRYGARYLDVISAR